MISDSHVDSNLELVELNFKLFLNIKNCIAPFRWKFWKKWKFFKWKNWDFCGCGMLPEVKSCFIRNPAVTTVDGLPLGLIIMVFGFLGVYFWFFERWKWFCRVNAYFQQEGKMISDSYVDSNVKLVEINFKLFLSHTKCIAPFWWKFSKKMKVF